MNVLGIVCSPRKGGNTEIMVSQALAGAGDAGADPAAGADNACTRAGGRAGRGGGRHPVR